MAMTTEEANELLPQTTSRRTPRPEGLCYLIIAEPKWGKTSWACSIPDALLLAFESGHAFQEAYKIVIDKWEGKHDIYEDEDHVRHMTMKQVSEILQASDRFNTVIFDTADMAAKSCSDFYMKKNGWNHLKDGGDYGVGHDIGLNDPFRHMVGAIMKTGRGVVFITHSKVTETKLKKNAVKKETTLPAGVYRFVHSQADVILHGSFGKQLKGRARDRIFQTAADEETLAGNRAKGVDLPVKFVVDPLDPWGQWCSFFSNPEAAELARLQIQEHSKLDEEEEEETPAAPEGEAAAEPAVATEEVEAETEKMIVKSGKKRK